MTATRSFQVFADHLRSADKPFRAFGAFLERLGVKGFSYGFIVLRAELERSDRTKAFFGTHSYPKHWNIETGAGHYHELGPGIETVLQSKADYKGCAPNLSEVTQHLPKLHRRQIATETDAGVIFGMTLLLDHSKTGFSGIVIWFENQFAAELFRRDWAHLGPILHKAAHVLDKLVRTEKPNTLVALTPRELDCLGLLLAGDRASEICWKLGVTEKTLEKHMLHARTKLKALTRDQALLKAVILGLIQL